MESLIIVFVFGALCFFIGWRAREVHATRKIDELTQHLAEDMLENFKSKVINIKVEDHDGTFFVYRKDDGSYLAHGENMSKLETILKEKFPDKMFNATPEDLEKLNAR